MHDSALNERTAEADGMAKDRMTREGALLKVGRRKNERDGGYADFFKDEKSLFERYKKNKSGLA